MTGRLKRSHILPHPPAAALTSQGWSSWEIRAKRCRHVEPTQNPAVTISCLSSWVDETREGRALSTAFEGAGESEQQGYYHSDEATKTSVEPSNLKSHFPFVENPVMCAEKP